jgi:hypothetical protein
LGRLRPAIDKKIPVTNYGMAIAHVQGILKELQRLLLLPKILRFTFKEILKIVF